MAISAANHEYFFMKLKTPDWIEPLAKAGRFKDPPNAKRQEGTISFPSWAESQYLVRVAGDAPDIVKQVILNVPETDNQRVHQDFVEAQQRSRLKKLRGLDSSRIYIFCIPTKSPN